LLKTRSCCVFSSGLFLKKILIKKSAAAGQFTDRIEYPIKEYSLEYIIVSK
jgi:hypothetical protein